MRLVQSRKEFWEQYQNGKEPPVLTDYRKHRDSEYWRVLAVCIGGLIGTALLYNYIVTTFSVALVSITTLGICLVITAAALAAILTLMDKNDYDL